MAFSGCFGLRLVVGSFDELAGVKDSSGSDEGDEVGCIHGSPAGLCGLDELEDNGKCRCSAACTFGDLRP
jgi:hypothetical protein